MGKHHKKEHGLGAAIHGRRQALHYIETGDTAVELVERIEAPDIARAVEKTNRATDAVWPTNEEELDRR